MNELYKLFKTHFRIGIAVWIFTFSMFFLPYMVEIPEDTPQIVFVAHYLIVVIVLIQISASLVPYIKDYFCYVRKGTFEQVTGKVDSYHCEETGGKNPKTVHNPIVIDEMTGEQLIMKIPNEKDARIGKTYTFIYLKNTQIAVISNEKRA